MAAERLGYTGKLVCLHMGKEYLGESLSKTPFQGVIFIWEEGVSDESRRAY